MLSSSRAFMLSSVDNIHSIFSRQHSCYLQQTVFMLSSVDSNYAIFVDNIHVHDLQQVIQYTAFILMDSIHTIFSRHHSCYLQKVIQQTAFILSSMDIIHTIFSRDIHVITRRQHLCYLQQITFVLSSVLCCFHCTTFMLSSVDSSIRSFCTKVIILYTWFIFCTKYRLYCTLYEQHLADTISLIPPLMLQCVIGYLNDFNRQYLSQIITNYYSFFQKEFLWLMNNCRFQNLSNDSYTYKMLLNHTALHTHTQATDPVDASCFTAI